jgi:hypothetical protein
MNLYKIIIPIFLFTGVRCQGIAQIVSNTPLKNDSIAVHIESCFCFLDSSSGVKKANCYFAIYNQGKQKIFFPQKLRDLDFGKTGPGLTVQYEVFYLGKDTIDVLKNFYFNEHPPKKIDKRTVEIEPGEEYYVRMSLYSSCFPYKGKYRIRFKLEAENKQYGSGTKGLKKDVYSRWVNFEWPDVVK